MALRVFGGGRAGGCNEGHLVGVGVSVPFGVWGSGAIGNQIGIRLRNQIERGMGLVDGMERCGRGCRD